MSRITRPPLWVALPLFAAVSSAWSQGLVTPPAAAASSPAAAPATPASTPPADATATDSAPPPTLPRIAVTARKNPDQSTLTQPDLPTARQRLAQTPGGAGVVDAHDYQRGRVSTLSDALGGATGVFVQPRFGAEEARVSIRGSGLQRTFHGRGLKLMQDGVPLNLADGSFDFQAVEALSARYVEVWRGANALQYGASNLGGAVNFVSPNGYNSDRFGVRVEGGSFGYRRAQLSAGDVVGRFDYYVSTSAFEQNGFRRHAKQDTRRNFANLGFQLSPQLETRFYVGRVDSDSELPGSLTRAQLGQDPRQGNAGAVAGDQHRDIGWTRVSNKTVYRDGDHQLELFVYGSEKKLHHPIFQVIDQQNRDAGLELRYTLEAPWNGLRNRLTLGLAPSIGKTNEDRYVNNAGQSAARTNQSKQRAENLEAYVEDRLEVVPQWSVIAGVQAVRAKRRLDDLFVAGTPADPVNEGFSINYHGVSPKLGVLWEPSPTLQVFSNLSRSFEPPTFGELAGGARPTLNEVQRGTTFELGSRGRLNRAVEWDASVYFSRITNELLQVATNSIGASVTVNAPRTVHRGLELGLKGEGLASATGRVEWRLNGLLNDFRFRHDATYGNNQLPGMPRVAARGELGYRFAGDTRLAATVEGADGYPIDFANSFGSGGYAVWGLKANGRFTPSLGWFVDARNLSDKRYAATTGVVRTAAGADTAQFMPGDGRSVYAGLDWRFQ